jgi:hypothetical protein
MGIPLSVFRTGDVYIEYAFEDVLFRYDHESGRYFRKFLGEAGEDEIEFDNALFNDALSSGVLTTGERYRSEGARLDPGASEFERLAVKHERIRPYWFTLMHAEGSGEIEVRADGTLELVEAKESAKHLLQGVVSDINSQPSISGVGRESRAFDYALRLELKRRGFSMDGESSYYLGRSAP